MDGDSERERFRSPSKVSLTGSTSFGVRVGHTPKVTGESVIWIGAPMAIPPVLARTMAQSVVTVGYRGELDGGAPLWSGGPGGIPAAMTTMVQGPQTVTGTIAVTAV